MWYLYHYTIHLTVKYVNLFSSFLNTHPNGLFNITVQNYTLSTGAIKVQKHSLNTDVKSFKTVSLSWQKFTAHIKNEIARIVLHS